MLAIVFYGLPIICVLAVLISVRRWVFRKQVELSGEDFRVWFQESFMGMKPQEHEASHCWARGKRVNKSEDE